MGTENEIRILAALRLIWRQPYQVFVDTKGPLRGRWNYRTGRTSFAPDAARSGVCALTNVRQAFGWKTAGPDYEAHEHAHLKR